jgi:hypothetical protein
MNHPEIDCALIGFSAGALTSLWIGYQLRKRVERWRARRDQRLTKRGIKKAYKHDVVVGIKQVDAGFPDLVGPAWTPRPKHIPFGDLGGVPRSEQDARQVLTDKPRTLPLEGRERKERVRGALFTRQAIPIDRATAEHLAEDFRQKFPAVAGYAETTAAKLAETTTQSIYEDVVAALVDSGFKRAVAATAAKECTLAERSGGLESWAAAAFRRATAKP